MRKDIFPVVTMKRYVNPQETREWLVQYQIDPYCSAPLLAQSRICEYAANEYILAAEQENSDILLFVKGIALVTVLSESGTELIICLRKPFDIFGDIEFILENKQIMNNVTAKTPCKLLALPKESLARQLRGDARFYQLIARTLANKLYETSIKYNRNLLYPLRIRFARFLEEIAADEGLLETVQYNELAKLLGVTDRQLRRVLAEFQTLGIIERNRSGIRIKDRERLRDIG